MELPKRKAINFDLDTVMMKQLNIYPDGYRLLGNSFAKRNFEHRQGSGYISKGELGNADIVDIIEKIANENPWLLQCVKKIDVTDIGRQYDLIGVLNNVLARNSGLTSTPSKKIKEELSEKDKTVIDRIQKSKQGATFQQLFNGKTVYGDRSDEALINILAFFSEGDSVQMARIFKASNLYTAVKSNKYISTLVSKAIEPWCALPKNKTAFTKGKKEGKTK